MLSERRQKFVDAFWNSICAGLTEREAMEEAAKAGGYNAAVKWRLIHEPEIREALIDRSTGELSLLLPEIVEKFKSILRDGTRPGAKNEMDAALVIMDRAGLIKKEKSEVEIKMPDGVVLLPAKNVEGKKDA